MDILLQILLITIPTSQGLYIASCAPDEGQSLSNLIDLTRLPKNLLIFDNGEFSTENPTLFHGAIAQDVGPIADFMAIVLNTVAASEVSEGAIAIQFAHQYTNRV